MPENTNTSSGTVRKLLTPTILYYLFTILIIVIGNQCMPSGPCTPGLGIMAFFLAVPTSVTLLFRNIYLGLSRNKTHFLVAALHAVVLTTFAVCLVVG